MDLPNRIKELMDDKGISAYKLAKISNVSSTYIREIIAGEKQPTVEVISRICNGFGITLVDFFSEESPELKPELRKLLETAKDFSPDQLDKLNMFLETIKGE